VEAVAPIEEPELMKELEGVLELYLNDDGAWHMEPDGTYGQKPAQGKPRRAQQALMKRWRGGLLSHANPTVSVPE
jgi:polyphosphate kinase